MPHKQSCIGVCDVTPKFLPIVTSLSGGNITSIMYLGLANMLMWQKIKEEREDSSNIGRYHNIINVMLLCVMHGNK